LQLSSFFRLASEHCEAIRLAFHLKSLQLSSQPGFAVLVRKTFGISLTLKFEADAAIFIEGMFGVKSRGCFHAGADTDKGSGRFFAFLPCK